MSSPNTIHPLENLRRRRAHLVAGSVVVAFLYAAIVLVIRIAVF